MKRVSSVGLFSYLFFGVEGVDMYIFCNLAPTEKGNMLLTVYIKLIINVIFILLYSITVLGTVIVVIAENRNPLKTIPWIIVLILAPGIGLVFYFFFGQDNRKQRIISRRTYKRILRPRQSKQPESAYSVPERFVPLATLLSKSNQSPLLYGTKIDVLANGSEMMHALIDAIHKAKHHVHIQYYIFSDDATGRMLKDALIEKAKEGVKVRLLYDDVGCWNVKKRFFREMKEAGIEVYPFLRVVFPIFSSKVNYRNHRKVVVIDGRIGFMGGMNIADRYVQGTEWGTWRDLHFRFDGMGVQGLQSAFLIDWYVVSKEVLNDRAYYPDPLIHNDNILQVATSGPVGQWRILLQAFIVSIANAKKYVYIQTPYFLPTEGLNQALQSAALGGVDVRLMLPKKSDTKATNWASHSYVDDMVKAGAKIYFYLPGFLHSKLMVVDDFLTSVGSANIDFRSFEHNFEINAFVYQKSFAEKMRDHFLEDMQHSEQLIMSRWLRRPRSQRFFESCMRLFSPLL